MKNMKNLLPIFVVLLLLFTAPVFATISSSVVLDVRTGGSNTNGGGFDPLDASGGNACGTDYSQQNSPQVVYTDLVIGATTTQLTSVGHPFTSAAICNLINITSGTGFTTGWYEIVNVVGGVATMDRSVGTTLSTGGHGNEGGGFQTIAQALSFQSTYAGYVTYIQNGTYTVTATINFSSSSWIGYGTSHGDITSVCAVAGTCPLITTATNSVVLMSMSLTNGLLLLQNLRFSNTAGTSSSGIVSQVSAGQLVLDNTVWTGFTIAVDGNTDDGWRDLLIHLTEITGSTVAAVEQYGPMEIDASYIHANTAASLTGVVQETLATSYSSITRTLIVNNTGVGYAQQQANGLVTFVDDVIANNSSDGIYSQYGGCSWFLENTIIYGNGGWGLDLTGGTQNGTTFYNNGFGSNTSGNYQGLSVYSNTVANSVTLTANPFVNSSGGNYALNSTAGGGAALKAAGIPGVFPGNLTTGYPDIGAAQTQCSSGSGSGPYGYVQ